MPKIFLSRRRLLSHALGLSLGAGLGGLLPQRGRTAATLSADPARLQAAVQALPDLAQTLLRRTSVPGLAVAVVHGGATIFAQGFGVRRADRNEAVDADTVFQLASVSKSLAATVVARQVGEGRVAWDTPMSRLLPWFALSNPDSTARVTVGDLFAHRSGLPDHVGDLLEMLGYSQREILERLRLVPVKPLGSAYAYTNFGLTAAAIGVAEAVDRDWATLSAESLYAPLGMDRTTSRYAEFSRQSNRAFNHIRSPGGGWQIGQPPPLDGGMAKIACRLALADAPGRWQPRPPHDADRQSPAGGVSSSVNDLARWLALLLAQGRWQGQQLVAAAALEAALSPQAPGGGYGYGFNVGGRTPGDLRLIDHSGAFEAGASTSFMLMPALDLAIVILSNAEPIGLPETLSRQFMDLAETGAITHDWWAFYSAAFRSILAPSGSLVGLPAPINPTPAQPLARYAGRYANAYFGPLQVEVATDGGDALQLTLGPTGQRHRLCHWSGDDFVLIPTEASAPLGSRSLVRFDLADGSVWLEFYADEGLGRFERESQKP